MTQPTKAGPAVQRVRVVRRRPQRYCPRHAERLLERRTRVRDELKNALPKIKPPRGPMQFDAYRQAISPIYITRTAKSAERLVNIVIDQIPAVSQETTWGSWNKSSHASQYS